MKRNKKGQFKKGHSTTYIGNPIYKNCLVCGKEFRTYNCHLKVGKGKYCSKECSMKVTNQKLAENGIKNRFNKGQDAWNFKGFTIHNNYKLVYKPEHPECDKHGYVREHRLIVEEKIGRILSDNEVVHHKDGDKLNNVIDNLEILSKGEHSRFHLLMRRT